MRRRHAVVPHQLQIQRRGPRLQHIQDNPRVEFPIRAALVYPPLQQTFENELLDYISRNTRLRTVDTASDLQLEGEITGYSLSPQAVTENAWASQTRLTISVRVKYTDNKKRRQRHRPDILGLPRLRRLAHAHRRARRPMPANIKRTRRPHLQRHPRQLVTPQ